MTTPAPPPAADPTPARQCQNCLEPLLGEHCYACGQPTKGLVRHFSSIVGDFMDSVFELDSRILRTLGPLLARPGYLSIEYFAGRRVRYVSPVRLFVFLSLFAFFAAQLSFNIDSDGNDPIQIRTSDGKDLATIDAESERQRLREATSAADVERIRDEALLEIASARKETEKLHGVGFEVALDLAESAIRSEARDRIAAIEASERSGEPIAPPSENEGTISFGGEPWHPTDNPLNFAWLGEGGNARLNAYVARAQDNIKRIQDDPNLLKDAFLSRVPTTLFLLLPLFALLLKIAYVFKRRIYMEHLIVALHSHSFLCAGLLLVLMLDALAGWTAALPWLSAPLGWLEIALIAWLPIYLLLMQKRVYGQGWLMTLFKYGVLGTCYLFLVSLGATLSLLVSLVNM